MQNIKRFFCLGLLSALVAFAATPTLACCKASDSEQPKPCHEEMVKAQEDTKDCCAEKFCQDCFMQTAIMPEAVSAAPDMQPIIFAFSAEAFRRLSMGVPIRPPMPLG
ncbi:MAG: hypothetical protein MRY32_10175 [Rickettsiales bacterium]|nr:hypothetical protein [Rickettsiales bacterium]